MKKDHRWLKSAIAVSQDNQVSMPWSRDDRHRPAAMQDASAPVKMAPIAAR